MEFLYFLECLWEISTLCFLLIVPLLPLEVINLKTGAESLELRDVLLQCLTLHPNGFVEEGLEGVRESWCIQLRASDDEMIDLILRQLSRAEQYPQRQHRRHDELVPLE
jgi:hypothetical protein